MRSTLVQEIRTPWKIKPKPPPDLTAKNTKHAKNCFFNRKLDALLTPLAFGRTLASTMPAGFDGVCTARWILIVQPPRAGGPIAGSNKSDGSRFKMAAGID
jgi:hypothetical protein